MSFQAGKGGATSLRRIGYVTYNWLTSDLISSNEIYVSKWELDICQIIIGLPDFFRWL
jgi:hypothetical protein